jgi:hypothetical protein
MRVNDTEMYLRSFKIYTPATMPASAMSKIVASFSKIGGKGSEVEADKTFVGGVARFMHARSSKRMITERGVSVCFLSHFASASRFSFAQSLSRCTAFSGGPPFGPHAQTPPVFAIVMQEHDLVFRHAQTYTTSFLFCLSGFALLRVSFPWPAKEDKLSIEKDKAVNAAVRLPNFSQPFISRPPRTQCPEKGAMASSWQQYPLKCFSI